VRFCVPTFGREEERLGAPGFAHVTEPVDLPPFVPGRWNEVLVTAVDYFLVPLGESLRLGRTAVWADVTPCRFDASTEPP
jgi:hypothetical protein